MSEFIPSAQNSGFFKQSHCKTASCTSASVLQLTTNMLLQTAEKMKVTWYQDPTKSKNGSSVAAVLMDVSHSSTGLAPSDFCLFSPLKKLLG